MPRVRKTARLSPKIRFVQNLLSRIGKPGRDSGRHQIELVAKETMGAPTDPISDFLTQIRNAARAGKVSVTIPCSKLTFKIVEILKREGFVENYKLTEEGVKRFVRVHLKYVKGKQPAIQALVRMSTPGLRHYVNSEEVPRVLGGLGVAILSTSKGILTDREARTQKVGGELLCKVW